MDARIRPGVSRERKSAANLDLVSDDGAVFVAHGLDFCDGKAAIAEIGERALQRLMEFVLQGGGLFRRSKDASVDTILLAMAPVGEENELHLPGIDGQSDLGLITKPGTRREQDEDEDENHGDIVLPGAAFIGP